MCCLILEKMWFRLPYLLINCGRFESRKLNEFCTEFGTCLIYHVSVSKDMTNGLSTSLANNVSRSVLLIKSYPDFQKPGAEIMKPNRLSSIVTNIVCHSQNTNQMYFCTSIPTQHFDYVMKSLIMF